MKKGQRKRIVLASILKPIDDTRMFEKIGVSLADTGLYEITIIGYPSSSVPVHSNITFVALKPFKRLSFQRWIASLKVLLEVLKVKPEAFIISTHELLIVAFLNRILFGTKIYYDIQENYYRNILHTPAFPALVRWPVAGWVRLKEKLVSPFFQHFFLAEKGYEKELTYLGNKYTVLENKVLTPKGYLKESKSVAKTRLVFTGTLAESTGIFQAIELAKRLHESDVKIELNIVGFCAQTDVLQRLKESIQEYPYIRLIGGDKLVPHHQIIEAIRTSDFGIICYPFSEHTRNSIPTKLYEYLGLQLPILLQNYSPWVELSAPFKAAIVVDFNQPDVSKILFEMNGPFYISTPQQVTWNDEATKLVRVIETQLCHEIP